MKRDASAKCSDDFSALFRSGTIRFEKGQADPEKDSGDYLDRLAVLAAGCTDFALVIDGHTDRGGRDAVNDELALARATTVRELLISRGIEAERLEAYGYSEQRPFDPANTQQAYALNRRVDFGVKPFKAAPAKADNESTAKPASANITPLDAAECGPAFSRLFLSETLRFEGSSFDVATSYGPMLDALANLMQQCPDSALAIGGHTDRRGNASFNQYLSEQRAEAVRAELVRRGIDKTRLTAQGYAGDRPFDPANTPAAYALNRRVDFGIFQTRSQVK